VNRQKNYWFVSSVVVGTVVTAFLITDAFASDSTGVSPAGGDSTSAVGAAPASSDEINEIVVTANKRAQSIDDVGQTITAIGAQALAEQNISSLQDLALAVPGLIYTQSESNSPVYSLRGVGFYETSLAAYPDVSVYLDEAPLPFPVLTKLTLFDLERVEVLKGPQGTLFGNNATGGAINYVAAKPTDTFQAGGSVSYGRFNTVQVNGFVSGPVADTLKMRVAISTTQGDGWQYSLTRPDDRNGAPDAFALRFLTDWRPSDALHLQIDLNTWRDHTQPAAPQFVKFVPNFPNPSPASSAPIAGDDPRAADWSTDYSPAADNRFVQAVIRTDYELTNTIALTSISSYIDYNQDQTVEGTGTAVHLSDLFANDGYIRSLSQEIRLSNGSSSFYRWLVGGNYSYDSVFENDFVAFNQGTSPPVYEGGTGIGYNSLQLMKNYAGFANGELDLGQFTAKAGLRYTVADRSADICAFSPAAGLFETGTASVADFFSGISSKISGTPTPTPGPYQCFILNTSVAPGAPGFGKPSAYVATLNQDNVSWRTGLDWKPTHEFLGYVNVATGYKAGSFPTLPGATFNDYRPVTQERLIDFEGGIKAQFLQNKLTVDAAAFHYDYTDKQIKGRIVDPVFNALDALVNIPKSTVNGGEVAINAKPAPGLTLSLAATYVEAKITDFTGINSDGIAGNFSGTQMPYSPKWSIGPAVNYRHALWDELTGFLGTQLTYRSGSNAAIGDIPAFALPSYTLLDVQAGVESASGRWKAFLWGKNVTNRFYLTNFQNFPDGLDRYVGQPATFGVTVACQY
jgi:iron complex outermembrane recepter protein